MPSLRRYAATLLLASLTGWAGLSHAADGPGLLLDAPQAPWPRWGARLLVGTEPMPAAEAMPLAGWTRPRAVQLLGDYYLDRPRLGDAGGLRLTSGLWMGAARDNPAGAGLPWAGAMPLASWPYLGIGYSAASLRGGWGLQADLGLAVRHPGGLRLTRLVSGSLGLDDALRDLRLRPMLQIGATYTF